MNSWKGYMGLTQTSPRLFTGVFVKKWPELQCENYLAKSDQFKGDAEPQSELAVTEADDESAAREHN
jgi:hypothetical protein